MQKRSVPRPFGDCVPHEEIAPWEQSFRQMNVKLFGKGNSWLLTLTWLFSKGRIPRASEKEEEEEAVTALICLWKLVCVRFLSFSNRLLWFPCFPVAVLWQILPPLSREVSSPWSQHCSDSTEEFSRDRHNVEHINITRWVCFSDDSAFRACRHSVLWTRLFNHLNCLMNPGENNF